MLTTELRTKLQQIKDGRWDAALESYFEKMPAASLISALASDYGIVFQERRVGRKHEIGIAKEVVYEMRFRKTRQSLLSVSYVVPKFRHCFLISSYDDALSEIVWTNRIDVKQTKSNGQAIQLLFGTGIKIDKTVDGWRQEPLLRRGVPLSEDALKKHGWQFAVLQPFGLHGTAMKP